MWNTIMDEHIQNLTVDIEKSFEPPLDKVNEIEGWFKQIYAKIDASDFQISNTLEPLHITAKGRKKPKKIVEKKENVVPDISPFDSFVGEIGGTRTSTRNSRASKRTSKLSKTAIENKSGLSDETFVVPSRSSRAASKAAAGKINSQLSLSLTKKLRRPPSEGLAHSSMAVDGLRTETSMDFQPPLSSTVVAKTDCGSPLPGPSVVKAHIEQFEKLNFQGNQKTPDEDSSQDENETPSKTGFRPTRVTRSKALKIKKSGGSTTGTRILKKQGVIAAKVKRLSLPKVKPNSDKKQMPEIKKVSPSRILSSAEAKNAAPNLRIGAASSNSDEAKKKREELLKKEKEEEARKKKKEEMLKAQSEENKRKREEKNAKVAAAREAAEKQKQEQALKLEKEKEERNKKLLLEREEKQKEEQAKKRNLAAQKAAEIEERRRQEDAARQARLRELSEEQKRNAALRVREQEEQAALKRKLEEEKQKAKKQGKENKKEVTEYKCTPTRDERPIKKPKTEEDYGLDDASASDSSEDESNPKKEIPAWAQVKNRNPQLLNQLYYPTDLLHQFMSCKKEVDLKRLFNESKVKMRTRTSSAVWTSPLSTTFTRK